MDIIQLINDIDSFVWGPAMIALLLGSHIFLTIRTGFIQRKLPQAIKISLSNGGGEGDISGFGALATALAATIGTGSIVGVATAVLAGGPGAILWMWLTGIFGMATKYSEVYISLKYRVKDENGQMVGGAMYAWERAFKRKDGSTPWWAKIGAVAFAVFTALAALGIGCAVQASSMTGIITSSGVEVEPWIIGLVIVVLSAIPIFGGVSAISNLCEKIVPFMAIGYALGCVVILVMNGAYIGESFALIFQCAFTGQAAFGGAVGSGIMVALQFGCARGLFSNESGLGSAPIVSAAARSANPAEQALIAMTGTFWSTVVICLLTGIVLVSTMLAYPEVGQAILAAPDTFSGATLAATAFSKIPYIGTPLLVMGMVCFSYSTIVGWSYYGNRAVTYLFGVKGIKPYQVIYVAMAFLGAIGVGDIAWTISDITNALMAIPNIIVVLLLSGIVAKGTKYFVYGDRLSEQYKEEVPTVKEC